MRPPHSMYMQHPSHVGPGQRLNGPYVGPGMGQSPPNVQVNPEGIPMGSQQEWRHMVMQQQSMNFNGNPGQIRPGFNPNGQGTVVS